MRKRKDPGKKVATATTTLSLRRKRNYLHIIDMAKNKTVLQTLGFAFGESEVSCVSVHIYNSSFGEGGCGVYGLGHRLSRRRDWLKSFLSSHKVSVGQLFPVLLYMTGQDG